MACTQRSRSSSSRSSERKEEKEAKQRGLAPERIKYRRQQRRSCCFFFSTAVRTSFSSVFLFTPPWVPPASIHGLAALRPRFQPNPTHHLTPAPPPPPHPFFPSPSPSLASAPAAAQQGTRGAGFGPRPLGARRAPPASGPRLFN